MTSIHKQIVVAGNTHSVQIDSSLELEEVEITGTDPISGKTVHISLSSILKPVSRPEAQGAVQITDAAGAGGMHDEATRENVENALNDLFNH